MEKEDTNWFTIAGISETDTPALLVYRDRVVKNIRSAIAIVKDVSLLRPHVKTSKMAEVCLLMMEEGIRTFKCATIAEAEMLALIKAPDVLLAYQPVGPKIQRLLSLVKTYPDTIFSCMVDNEASARDISALFLREGITLPVFIDLNVGMDRTGIIPGEKALDLYSACIALPGVNPVGLHVYDGHIRSADAAERKRICDAGFKDAEALADKISDITGIYPKIVAGGSSTFAAYSLKEKVQCSPGTFVFWDGGYAERLAGEPFIIAALLLTRIVSVLGPETICTDLGTKAIASEMALPRVHFLNAPGARQVSHSEEHMVVQVPDSSIYKPGDILYGVPVHICPSVALYDKAAIVEEHRIQSYWNVVARGRSIKI